MLLHGSLPVRLLLAATLIAPAVATEGAVQRLTAGDAERNDWFGFASAVDGDTAMVGALRDDDACPQDPECDSGAVYVFERGDGVWSQAQKLVASDPVAGAQFGISVDIDGDRAVIGAYGHPVAGFESGAAYVFERSGSGWVETQRLTPDVHEAGGRFGWAVAIEGDRILVGAHLTGADAGAAYLFEHDGTAWGQSQVLAPPGGLPDDGFYGYSVDLGPALAVVGASHEDVGDIVDAGAAHVWLLQGESWVHDARLTSDLPGPDDRFGTALALEGMRVAVGAWRDDEIATNAGAVYLFESELGAWLQRQKLHAHDAAPEDYFGTTVALERGRILVGARRDDDIALSSGSAYLFAEEEGGWTEAAKLTAQDPAAGNLFGNNVVLSGDTALVGSVYTDDVCPDDFDCNSGSVYVYSLSVLPEPALSAVIEAGFDPAHPDSIPLSEGGSQRFSLKTCVTSEGNVYLLLGSFTGVSPGIVVEGLKLPLNADAYLVFTATTPNSPLLPGSLGVLDANGAATASFTLPPGTDPALAGVTLHHAWVELSLQSLVPLFASNPVPVTLRP
jgi:hypothetical protein